MIDCPPYKQGPPGPPGVTPVECVGVQGPEGPPGKDGKDGLNGKDGKDGLNGRDGADGRPGRDGANGGQGPEGPPGPATSITWTDETQRITTQSTFVGQLGLQTDNGTLWRSITTGSGLNVWTLIPFITRSVADTAARNLAVPAYVDQLLLQKDSGVLYYASGAGAGQWTPVGARPTVTPPSTTWDINVVPATVPVSLTIPGETMLPGSFVATSQFNVDAIRLTVAQPGRSTSSAVFRIHLPDSGRTVTVADVTIPPGASTVSVSGAGITTSVKGVLDPVTYLYTGGISAGERIVVELISVGEVIPNVTTTAGSSTSTIPAISLGKSLTGTNLKAESGAVSKVLSIKEDGNVILSQPVSVSAAAANVYVSGREFVRGVFFGSGLPTGTTTVPLSAVDAELISIGDIPIGPTVEPGTTVLSVDAGVPELELSRPLLGNTVQIGFINPAKSSVIHFTHMVNALTGAGAIALPVTEGIRDGDYIRGGGVPANSMVEVDAGVGINLLDDTATPVVLTAPPDNITISSPERVLDAWGVPTSLILFSNFGIKIGYKIEGPWLAPETYVYDLVGAFDVVMNKRPIGLPVAGDRYKFTREKLFITAPIVTASILIQLPYAVSTTALSVGDYLMPMPGIQSGTYIVGLAGSTVSLSKPVTLTNPTAGITFIPDPQWKGLSMSLQGHWQP